MGFVTVIEFRHLTEARRLADLAIYHLDKVNRPPEELYRLSEYGWAMLGELAGIGAPDGSARTICQGMVNRHYRRMSKGLRE